MFRILLLFVFLGCVEASNFGVGFMVGEPTAFCGKLFLNRTQALSFALGWSWYHHHSYHDGYYTDDRCYGGRFYDDHRGYCDNNYYGDYYRHYNNYHLHLDYLFHKRLTPILLLYGGPGIVLESFEYIGIRGDFGLSIVPSSIIDIFFELTPTLFLNGGPYMDVDGGLGFRFWF